MFNIMNPSLIFSLFISVSLVSRICGGLIVGWNMKTRTSNRAVLLLLAQKILHSHVKSYFFLNVGGSEKKILSNQGLENGLIGQTSVSNCCTVTGLAVP